MRWASGPLQTAALESSIPAEKRRGKWLSNGHKKDPGTLAAPGSALLNLAYISYRRYRQRNREHLPLDLLHNCHEAPEVRRHH